MNWLFVQMKMASSYSKNYHSTMKKRIFMMCVTFGRPYFDFDGSWLAVDFWRQNGIAALSGMRLFLMTIKVVALDTNLPPPISRNASWKWLDINLLRLKHQEKRMSNHKEQQKWKGHFARPNLFIPFRISCPLMHSTPQMWGLKRRRPFTFPVFQMALNFIFSVQAHFTARKCNMQ